MKVRLKIKDRLTFLTSAVFGIMFTVASVLVYILFFDSSEKIILDQLEKTARLTGLFYLEEDELPKTEHRKIKREFQEQVLNIEVRLYDEENMIEFGIETDDSTITSDMLDQVRKRGNAYFKRGEYYYYGIFYPDNQGDFVVMLKENRDFFHIQSGKVLLILLLVLIGGLGTIIILSKLLSHIAYKPVNDVIKQVNAINTQSLDNRIRSTGNHDEVQMLIDTFNDLLRRLSENFEMQRNFINYFSHEVKTPLASISGNVQVFSRKSRSPEEYEKIMVEILSNVTRIEEIMNTLMVVSGLKESERSDESFRLDELVWNVIERLSSELRKNALEFKIEIPPGRETLLNVSGNESQIRIAVQNLIENACKFSRGQTVTLRIVEEKGEPVLIIKDYGIGIPERDLKRIEEPFFRAGNTGEIKGNGIGLAVASRILKHNRVKFDINSDEGEFTVVKLTFSSP